MLFFWKTKKTPLERYQDKLLSLLYSGASPELIQKILQADCHLTDYHPAIEQFEPKMIETGRILVRKWRRQRTSG
ncbi:MAG: hypothetical protein H6855_07075 [Rhodospirillales bacterium]|nr:hypothetical protein [Rhodospirillales bacterium]MCB9965825.1 hypothetical protein [Rhodospirillales bacterium]